MHRAAVRKEMEQAPPRLPRSRQPGSTSRPAATHQRHPLDQPATAIHMLFGYLIVCTLMPLVHGFGHLSEGWTRRFPALLCRQQVGTTRYSLTSVADRVATTQFLAR